MLFGAGNSWPRRATWVRRGAPSLFGLSILQGSWPGQVVK